MSIADTQLLMQGTAAQGGLYAQWERYTGTLDGSWTQISTSTRYLYAGAVDVHPKPSWYFSYFGTNGDGTEGVIGMHNNAAPYNAYFQKFSISGTTIATQGSEYTKALPQSAGFLKFVDNNYFWGASSNGSGGFQRMCVHTHTYGGGISSSSDSGYLDGSYQGSIPLLMPISATYVLGTWAPQWSLPTRPRAAVGYHSSGTFQSFGTVVGYESDSTGGFTGIGIPVNSSKAFLVYHNGNPDYVSTADVKAGIISISGTTISNTIAPVSIKTDVGMSYHFRVSDSLDTSDSSEYRTIFLWEDDSEAQWYGAILHWDGASTLTLGTAVAFGSTENTAIIAGNPSVTGTGEMKKIGDGCVLFNVNGGFIPLKYNQTSTSDLTLTLGTWHVIDDGGSTYNKWHINRVTDTTATVVVEKSDLTIWGKVIQTA